MSDKLGKEDILETGGEREIDYDEAHPKSPPPRAKPLGPWTDAARARAHVLSLMSSRVPGSTDGLGLGRLGRIAGVSRGTLQKLVYGGKSRSPTVRVRLTTERKILCVTAESARASAGEGASIDAGDTSALVDCLASFGMSRQGMARALGKKRFKFSRVRVRPRTARDVWNLHWRLWTISGTFRGHCDCVQDRRMTARLEKETS